MKTEAWFNGIINGTKTKEITDEILYNYMNERKNAMNEKNLAG